MASILFNEQLSSLPTKEQAEVAVLTEKQRNLADRLRLRVMTKSVCAGFMVLDELMELWQVT